MKTSKRVFEREKGLLPVVVIEKDLSNRMASTIRTTAPAALTALN